MRSRYVPLLFLAVAASAAPAKTSFRAYSEALRSVAVASATGVKEQQFEKMAVALFEYLEGPPTGEQLAISIPHMRGVFVDLYVPPPDQIIVYVQRGIGLGAREYGFSFDRKSATLRSVTVVEPK